MAASFKRFVAFFMGLPPEGQGVMFVVVYA